MTGEATNVYVTQQIPNNVVIDDTMANRVAVEITEEQANIVRIATTGAQGPPGTQIISGDGPPSNSIGRIGDFFIDVEDGRLWGPKTASGWGTGVAFGANRISELEDVALATPVENQSVLMWDTNTSTWVNQRIRYTHTQGVPAAVWNINHGLRGNPSGISVFDTSGTNVFGEVAHVDGNNLTITFSAAFAGIAYLG